MPAACPHCQAATTGSSAFCTSCGKALPAATATGPRIVGENEIATSAAALSLQTDDLRKQLKSAFNALLAVGVVQLVFTAIGFAVTRGAGSHAALPPVVFFITGAIGLLFFGLAAWAKKSPLPASIVGLTIYISLWALDAVAGIASGHPEVIAQGWLMKIIIIACLSKGISAGLKVRAIREQQANQPQRRAGAPTSMAA